MLLTAPWVPLVNTTYPGVSRTACGAYLISSAALCLRPAVYVPVDNTERAVQHRSFRNKRPGFLGRVKQTPNGTITVCRTSMLLDRP